MVNERDVLSELKIVKLYFEKISVSVVEAPCEGSDVKVSYNVSLPQIAEKRMKLKFYCHAEAKDEMKMELLLVGVFEADDTNIFKMVIPNAIAIMMPYIRAEAARVTSNLLISPLILQPIDIRKLYEGEAMTKDEIKALFRECLIDWHYLKGIDGNDEIIRDRQRATRRDIREKGLDDIYITVWEKVRLDTMKVERNPVLKGEYPQAKTGEALMYYLIKEKGYADEIIDNALVSCSEKG